ncbi:uracil-DNA glycosylase [Vampirovibrio chlorellavorus]|uniref:uracil-DNA glycosylase n=1 Tax=Vampirovibrio chlorellavorus TaxID=758823 RepID=UPI0026F28F07|nr:uracil-DNA glycosylase [Vampirovibrio chlorellavorus]
MSEVTRCHQCPRLVAWRELVAESKVKRYADQLYWGRPVPSLGDPNARLLLVGLAPAAHGGNRTGRMFTGDRSGDWLYRALHKAGFANQPESINLSDGLHLKDCYITAVAHCAPPDNKLLPAEMARCRPYLSTELALLSNVKVIIALGKVAWDAILKEPTLFGPQAQAPTGKVIKANAQKREAKPAFGHGLVYELSNGLTLIGSYHPSQQNTFTGRLTEPMFDHVFALARRQLDKA